jgi:hypothetical protein
MHVVQHVPRRRMERRRVLPSPGRRIVVNDVHLGLGEVDGLFNIGKMFTRLVTITPSSFKLKNIAGAIGSLVTTTATMGVANVASELAKGKGASFTSAHSKPMQYVGYGTLAAGAVVGAVVAAPMVGSALGIGGTAATGTGLTVAGEAAAGSGLMAAGTGVLAPVAETSFFAAPSVISTGSTLMPAGAGVLAPIAESGGILSMIGSGLSTIGSGIMTGIKAIGSVLPVLGQVAGGGGGGGQVVVQQGADQNAAAQAYYAQQQALAQQEYIRAQQAAMYQPGYNPNIPYVTDQYTGAPLAPSMNTSYGDLRSPYTAITEDGEQVQVDPATGQIVQPGFSTAMWVGGGAIILLLGMYVMSDDK